MYISIHLTDLYHILFTSRFGLDSVERAATNVFIHLMEKQKNEQDPKAKREIEDIKDKLRKVDKSLTKCKTK